MVRAILAGDMATASALQEALSPLFGIVTVKADSARVLPDGTTVTVQDKFRNPIAIKTLMNALGMSAGPARQPLGKMNSEGVDVVRNAARTVWSKNPEILAPIGEFYGVDIEARINEDSVWAQLSYPM